MKILNAMQQKNGVASKFHKDRMGTLTQPVQFLKMKEKDDYWRAWNMDWYERIGMSQVNRNSRRLLKNYKLANGIIDKTDYIVEEDNETADMIEMLTKEDESAFELKFFPIIPNIINVLEGEFAKRNDKINYRSVDDTSYNEMLEQKRKMIEDVLMQRAAETMQQTIQGMRLDMESEEGQQQAQQMMTPENLKTLPGIQEYFSKTYRSQIEQWATHQHNVDDERFKMKELETLGFGDMLRTDREFWHFEMRENDYEMKLWNPVLTFYHKSPDVRYVSQGNWVGNFDIMSIPDVIDKYGYLMDEDELNSLEEIYPIKAAGYLQNMPNDGSYYDPTHSREWNSNAEKGPGLAMRQHNSFNELANGFTGNSIDDILKESEDFLDYGRDSMLRVTTAYWKSQKKIGHYSWIDKETGVINDMIVSEDFKITDPGVYDTTVVKEKTRETLIAGEHVDWIWINETWGGIKIGNNRAINYANDEDSNSFSPIYLNVAPIKFQFKGDYSLYGCKLPVEGAIFSDRNTKSTSLVDKMKPYQIGYNLVNNQIADILIDELGTVIMLDQNSLPKHSLGEDWGKDSYANAYVAMKDFQMLPLDTSLRNTEGATNFNNYQVLNMEQSGRLMSRIQLANYFKQQCFESIGISQQRMGAVNAQETATGVEQAINMSYSQTEIYFINHSENLMPRVHQMRTDLAQYYHSKKPSVRLQYMTSLDEKVSFEINGTDLMMRELNVFVSTKVNQKQIMEQIKNLAIQNNTAGASIYDLGNIIKADSMSEIDHVIKS